METIKVLDVYGDVILISRNHYKNPKRTLIPIYSSQGKLLIDSKNINNTSIHRDNIVSIVQE
jgi:hypothetical protein